ncbi:MAG: hypothetical protein B6245_22350 [Desulfobacteraceae bacterium 4572_88]|nr:MAG: hypothetical protein B6245_22350 [Desulfobacteraceae bacterium 4572_88]
MARYLMTIIVGEMVGYAALHPPYMAAGDHETLRTGLCKPRPAKVVGWELIGLRCCSRKAATEYSPGRQPRDIRIV